MVYEAGLGHIGGEFSALDILTVLYHAVLRIDPQRPDWPERDRFILSKGHAAAALYTTLAGAGFIDVAELDTCLAPLSRLNGHPDRKKVPGVETNTGPLGHGFPVAVGTALAGQLDGSERRTFVLCGDGELQEGSMWEAAMAGAHFGLERLDAHRRSQRAAAGRRDRDARCASTPSPIASGPSAGPCARSMATTTPRCWRPSPRCPSSRACPAA